MGTRFSKLKKVSAVVAACLVVGGLGIRLAAGSMLKTQAEEAIRSKFVDGTQVQIGRAELKLVAGVVYLREIDIRNPAGFPDKSFLQIDKVKLNVEPGSLLGDTIHIQEISVEDIRANFGRLADGRTNIRELLGVKEKSEGKSKEQDQPKAESTKNAEPAGKAKKEKSGKKILIDEVSVEDVRVKFRSDHRNEKYQGEVRFRLKQFTAGPIAVGPGEKIENKLMAARVKEFSVEGPEGYPFAGIFALPGLKAEVDLEKSIANGGLFMESLDIDSPVLNIATGPDGRTSRRRASRIIDKCMSRKPLDKKETEPPAPGEPDELEDEESEAGTATGSEVEAEEEESMPFVIRHLELKAGAYQLANYTGSKESVWEMATFSSLNFSATNLASGVELPGPYSMKLEAVPDGIEGASLLFESAGESAGEDAPGNWSLKMTAARVPYHPFSWGQDKDPDDKAPRLVHALLGAEISGEAKEGEFKGKWKSWFEDVDVTEDRRSFADRMKQSMTPGASDAALAQLIEPGTKRTRPVEFEMHKSRTKGPFDVLGDLYAKYYEERTKLLLESKPATGG